MRQAYSIHQDLPKYVCTAAIIVLIMRVILIFVANIPDSDQTIFYIYLSEGILHKNKLVNTYLSFKMSVLPVFCGCFNVDCWDGNVMENVFVSELR